MMCQFCPRQHSYFQHFYAVWTFLAVRSAHGDRHAEAVSRYSVMCSTVLPKTVPVFVIIARPGCMSHAELPYEVQIHSSSNLQYFMHCVYGTVQWCSVRYRGLVRWGRTGVSASALVVSCLMTLNFVFSPQSIVSSDLEKGS